MPIAFLKKHIPFKTILNVLIEFGPLIMFFVAFEIFKFMTAVAILIATVVVALIASIIVQRRIAWFPILSCGSVMLFGGLTLFLHNPNWIIFKDTLYFGLFGVAIIIELIRGKLMLKKLFGNVFHVDDRVWKISCIVWGVFLILLAASNEIARIFFTPEQWVTYKIIVLVIMFGMAIINIILGSHGRLPGSDWLGFHK